MKKPSENLLAVKIETERLLLRSISLSYASEMFREFTPEITKYMYPRSPKEIGETEDFIRKSLAGLEAGSNLQLVALRKGSNEFLGCVGLHQIDTKTPEMGIWLKKSAQGGGFGREAMMAVKKWADENLEYDYIIYPVAKENIPSRKIPESMGAKVEAEYDKTNLSGVALRIVEYQIYS